MTSDLSALTLPPRSSCYDPPPSGPEGLTLQSWRHGETIKFSCDLCDGRAAASFLRWRSEANHVYFMTGDSVTLSYLPVTLARCRGGSRTQGACSPGPGVSGGAG
ncbi:hypothetical protein BS78_05G068800 [Paspalum vaginatum]|nr:hypothetical protein BS78_05G068800 [Paspalum vaginatum]